MKWLASLLILMSIGGTFCDDNDDDEMPCLMREKRKCNMMERPTEFPQAAEDLLSACRLIISKANCLVEAGESCSADESFYTARMTKAVEYLKSMCQEENPTFTAIARNLPCVERVLKSRKGSCTNIFSEKNLLAIETHIERLLLENYANDLAECLFDSIGVACEGITFGYHCGEEVKEAAEEIEAHINRQNYLECTPEQREELSPFMRVFEGILMEEIELENSLERKRK